jgi:hypothetical protein
VAFSRRKEGSPEKETPDSAPDTPLPLLDLSDAAVKKLIRSAKKRGYVTHDQINSVLPSEEVNSEQIEDVLAMFREIGVNFVETQETSREGAEPSDEEESGARKPTKRPRGRAAIWSRYSRRSRPRTRPRSRQSARMTRCACICAKCAR